MSKRESDLYKTKVIKDGMENKLDAQKKRLTKRRDILLAFKDKKEENEEEVPKLIKETIKELNRAIEEAEEMLKK
jgi:hypothetical protein